MTKKKFKKVAKKKAVKKKAAKSTAGGSGKKTCKNCGLKFSGGKCPNCGY